MIVRLSLLTLIILMIFSCENQSEFYGDPHIKSTYTDGSKKEVRKYISKDSTDWIETVYHRNGEVSIKGKMINGEREGEWSAWDKNNKLLTVGHYKNGEDYGKKVVYYPNGNIRYEGEFTNGERTGTWKFYFEDGKLAKEINY